jgi:hypothetical protein
VRLRIDPWDPEYGASAELDADLGPPVGLDLSVETDAEWRPVGAPSTERVPCCAFVDGVRRIDARLFAEDSDTEAPALAGSWAVGCAWSRRPPTIDAVEVGRELVVGGGLEHGGLTVNIGSVAVEFRPSSVPGNAPLDPLRGLQNKMRTAEADLAASILGAGEADLVVSDGPLSYFAPGPAIGLVKRQSRAYLDPARAAVIADLRTGDRTPIFKLGAQRLERYSWYLRLAPRRAIDGSMAGVVRLEVAATAGLAAAQTLADLAGSLLPLFASQPAKDPRAPQNLYPVGALEGLLRRRLGDQHLIHRALETHLFREVNHA